MRKFEKIAVSSTAMTGKIVALVAVFALMFGIVSCKNNVDEPEKPVYYTVTFDSDGGSSVEAQNVESGKTAEKPTDPTKTGYDFGGWYNGTSAFDFTKSVTEKITLKAKWTLHAYTITYNLDGGTNNSENPATYTIEDEITLKDAEKTGRTFSGWFNENTKVTKIAKGTTGNITLTAKWDLATYDVTLNVNGGTITEGKNVTTYTYGTAVTLPTTSEITRTGYKFEGWFTSNDNGTTLTGEAVTEITATDTGNKVFYAKWTECTYTVTLNANGGTISEGKNVTTYTYGTAATLPTANDITRSGYKFCGWFISNDNGLTLTGEAVSSITATDIGNKVFYAKWTEIYTITYNDVESGLTNPNPTTYTIEDEITLVEIKKEGYDFAWYDAAEGGNVITKITKGSTGVKTLWARWTAIEYTVTVNGFEGYAYGFVTKNNDSILISADSNTFTYTVEDSIKFVDDHFRWGGTLGSASTYATFEGMYDAETGGNKVTLLTKGSTGNKTLWGRWNLIEYTIIYEGLPVGVENPNPTSYTVDELPIKLKNITNKGKVYWWKVYSKTNSEDYWLVPNKNIIPNGSSSIIKAEAQEVELRNLTLIKGSQINKLLCKYEDATSFRKSDAEPENPNMYLAGEYPNEQIPLWYDSETKTIWYYAPEGAVLYLNADSSQMFKNMSKLDYIELSDFDTSNVTNMSEMFAWCSALTALDVSDFDTNNVTNMSEMFSSCESLTTLDVSKFSTENVEDMSSMFYKCSLATLDVNNFNTSKVTNMNMMFCECRNLTSLDMSKWNTSKVQNMSNMFGYCKSLTSLDLSGFDTSNVTNMSFMFIGCASLTELDLSSFIMENISNSSFMFQTCSELTTIYVTAGTDLSVLETLTNSTKMFSGCNKLIGGAGSACKVWLPTDKTYARVDGGTDSPGYFTVKE